MKLPSFVITFKQFEQIKNFCADRLIFFIVFALTTISFFAFLFYLENGLGLAYNDARSHLDIGRRVVEGLKPGLAQIGSVWLPLPHLLMVPTIWNDFMWHTGLSGAIQSMISFITTGIIIYYFLAYLKVGIPGRLIGVLIFVTNINILYLQSTAMTELLLIATMTIGVFELTKWHHTNRHLYLIRASFWIMLATLIRYDGWFLLAFATVLVLFHAFRTWGYKTTEGLVLLFLTVGSLGIILWVLWNQIIFKDALYFIFGPYSAHAQQNQLEEAGVLATKKDLWLSLKIYVYALAYNSYAFNIILSVIGAIFLWMDKSVKASVRIATTALFAPFLFNVLALYLGHSVLFIQGISGDSWFNVRYGVMMVPSIAIFIGYLFHKAKPFQPLLAGMLFLVILFGFINYDAVTIDDARVGSSQKNVSEVSGWLKTHAKEKEGFVLISAASHDAIIFSSTLPMKKFIHEGTGSYWESATTSPDRWARWIIMRTNDVNDQTFKLVSKTPGYKNYRLVAQYPFADIYELKEEYLKDLTTKPILKKQK